MNSDPLASHGLRRRFDTCYLRLDHSGIGRKFGGNGDGFSSIFSPFLKKATGTILEGLILARTGR